MKTKKLCDFDRDQIVAIVVPNDDAGGFHEVANVPSQQEAFLLSLDRHRDTELTRVSETEWESGSVAVLTVRPNTILNVSVPAEFIEFCEECGLSPVQVFSGLMGDLCDINRPDLVFNSHGSDERELARRWFERVSWNTGRAAEG